jgi:4-hydroxy-3-methylbut-2-enyl diphosphate reductase
MRVIRADVMGLCFGVRDALAIIDQVEDPQAVTIHGQLVHNEVVLADLKARGFTLGNGSQSASPSREAGAVLITAHGISDLERQRLESSGARLIDTTCPLVLRVHAAAKSLQAQGYHVLVIGRKGHVEVRGIVEDLDSVDVVEDAADVVPYGHSRLGIICQTTVPEDRVKALRDLIAARNPDAEIKFIDTVCQPTKEHQRSLQRMLAQVEGVVVVGGKGSNNTRELVERCRLLGRPAFHVQTAADLDVRALRDFSVIGLTAGTSTLDRTIDEVYRALIALEPRAFGAGVDTGPDDPLCHSQSERIVAGGLVR